MIKKPKVKKISKLRWVPLYIFFIISILSFYIGQKVDPVTSIAYQVIDVKVDNYGKPYFIERGKPVYSQFIKIDQSALINGDHTNTSLIE